jgi:hypothetical protein
MYRLRPDIIPSRSRRRLAILLILAATAFPIWRTSAGLIRAHALGSLPGIAADISGVVAYDFDPASRTGTFRAVNIPYLLSGWPGDGDEATIRADGEGVRRQVVRLALDERGRLLPGPGNSFELYGKVVAGGQVYDGLLLKGTPTAFGWHNDPAPSSRGPKVAFDLNVSVTGGSLASAFGPDLYLRYEPRRDVTFRGQFTEDFGASKASSDTLPVRASRASLPWTPAALTIVLAVGFACLRFARARVGQASDLLATES